MNAAFRALLLTPLLALGSHQAAQAIVVNSTFGAAGALAYGAGFSSVVTVSRGSGTCSGAVISATAILTAQHCTFGTVGTGFSIGFDQNGDGAFDLSLATAAKFELDATNVLLDGTDMAILTLNAAMPAWATPFSLYAGDPLGQVVALVGRGRNGVGTVGAGIGPRWAADNVVDAVGTAPYGGAGTDNIISTDFDDGTTDRNTLGYLGSAVAPLAREGTTAGGDSGGPLLVSVGGGYAIAGVLSGGTRDDSGYGDVSWWTGISRYRAEIERYGGVFFNGSVPEPGSMALALLALGVAGSLRGRRQAG